MQVWEIFWSFGADTFFGDFFEFRSRCFRSFEADVWKVSEQEPCVRFWRYLGVSEQMICKFGSRFLGNFLHVMELCYLHDCLHV